MPFSTLLGNQRIKDNLTTALRQGKLAHFYLICGAPGAGKKTLARLLSAAAMCESTHKPCGKCESCRKVLSAVHPDVITVEDPEHKTVPVRTIRQMREDVFIRPNEGSRKIYIFPQEMGLEGQNALLKILEEPPSYGLFLLLTENPEQLLPTVRSRCVELKLQPLERAVLLPALKAQFPHAEPAALEAAMARSGGALGQARLLLQQEPTDPQTQAFAQAFAQEDALALARVLVPMEKYKRDQLLPLLQQWAQLLQEALVLRCGGQSVSAAAQAIARQRNAPALNAAIACLQKCIAYGQGNVSCAAICGYLSWHLRS